MHLVSFIMKSNICFKASNRAVRLFLNISYCFQIIPLFCLRKETLGFENALVRSFHSVPK